MSDTATQQPIRATAIKAGALSMLHMRHALTVGRKDTPALRWGRLVHLAVLQPLELLRLPKWEGYEGKDGEQTYAHRGAAWTEFCAEVGDREYIGGDEVEPLERITVAAARALAHLPRIAETEVRIDWTDPLYGRAVARIDAILDGGGWLELKTTGNIKRRAFMSQCESLGYPLQLGWYAHGLASRGHAVGQCWMLALESDMPHAIGVFSVPQSVLSDGYEAARQIALAYRACEAVDSFPGPYDDGAGDYERPAWATGGGDGGEVDVSNGQTMEASEL